MFEPLGFSYRWKWLIISLPVNSPERDCLCLFSLFRNVQISGNFSPTAIKLIRLCSVFKSLHRVKISSIFVFKFQFYFNLKFSPFLRNWSTKLPAFLQTPPTVVCRQAICAQGAHFCCLLPLHFCFYCFCVSGSATTKFYCSWNHSHVWPPFWRQTCWSFFFVLSAVRLLLFVSLRLRCEGNHNSLPIPSNLLVARNFESQHQLHHHQLPVDNPSHRGCAGAATITALSSADSLAIRAGLCFLLLTGNPRT